MAIVDQLPKVDDGLGNKVIYREKAGWNDNGPVDGYTTVQDMKDVFTDVDSQVPADLPDPTTVAPSMSQSAFDALVENLDEGWAHDLQKWLDNGWI